MQVFGLSILMMLDRQETAETWWRTVRANIGAAHPAQMRELLPEFFGDDEKDKVADAVEIDKQATAEDGTKDIDRVDQHKIKWTTPESTAERDEIDAFLTAARSNTHSITATELEEGGKWL